MRLLWVKIGGLWPPNVGGRIRSFHMLRELSRRHDVALLTTHGPADDPEALAARLGCQRLVSFPYAAPKTGSAAFARALARSWLSALPADLFKWRVAALRREAERTLAAGEVDLCVADFLTAVPNLPPAPPVPLVLFEHNVEHLIWRRLAAGERRPLRRALLEIEWRKMRRFERSACAGADLNVAVSEEERDLLERLAPGRRARVVPTGVDTSYFRPLPTSERPGSLVFTGAMDWQPNEDGILRFVEETLPRVRRGAPEASLTVVGRNPSARLRAVAEAAGVRVTGTVGDVRPHIAEAAVYVVPLRIGGGTRLKIFEALAMAKAVVSTTVGAEGLPLVEGEHFLRADDPEGFAAAVVGLLRDPARRRALGGAGRRLVEQGHSWASVARAFEERCEEAVGRPAARRLHLEAAPAPER